MRRIQIIHTPVGTMGTEKPYVVADIMTDISQSNIEYIAQEEWKKFQATQPDTDSLFEDWLTARYDAISSAQAFVDQIHI